MCYRKFVSPLVVVCLLTLPLSSTISADLAVGESRIVGGYRTHIGHNPCMVQVRLFDQCFCAGAILDPRFVITAAHCFDDIPTTHFQFIRIVGGANSRSDPGVQRRIAQMRTSGLYSKATMDSDVAIIKLDAPMVGPFIQPVSLSAARPKPGELIQVSGWGDTTYKGVKSNELRTVRIPVISREQCQTSYDDLPITDNMFCAFDSSKDSCQGDSGGPVMYKGQMCGVVSFGKGCGSGFPGVYTNLNALKPFISKSIASMIQD